MVSTITVIRQVRPYDNIPDNELKSMVLWLIFILRAQVSSFFYSYANLGHKRIHIKKELKMNCRYKTNR